MSPVRQHLGYLLWKIGRHGRLRWSVAARLVLALVTPALATLAASRQEGIRRAPQVEWQAIHHGLESHATLLALAADPQNPQMLYAGAYHQVGLYRSADGGDHWQDASRGLEGRSVFDLLVVPSQVSSASAIYAGATDGLYRSDDGGWTWSSVQEVPSATIFALARDGRGRVYCGTDGLGIYRSDEAPGEKDPPTYTPISLGPHPADQVVLSLDVSEDGQTILVGTNGWGALISHDGGHTWKVGLEEGFVSEVALIPGDPQKAWVRTRKGLYRTNDGGDSWTFSSAGIEKRVDALAVDPDAPQTLYAGVSGSGVWLSQDGGETWQRTGPGIRPWAAIFDLLVVRAPETVLYAAAWDGFYRSSDGGQNWQRLNAGLGHVQVRALALHPQNPSGLYAADLDGLHASSDGGETWTCLDRGPLEKGYLSIAFSPSDPNVAYAGSDGGGVARSTDGGRTWTVLDSTPKVAFPDLLVHPAEPDHLLARVSFDRVYASEDGGVTWSPHWEGLGANREVISLYAGPGDTPAVYAGTDEGLYVSHDWARHWQPLGPELLGRTIFCVLADPGDPAMLYAGVTDGPFRSEDGGRTWQRWGRSLENTTVTVIAFDPVEPAWVYAGSKYQGLYWSPDSGQTWQPLAFPGTSIEGLLLDPAGRHIFTITSSGLYRGEVSR